MLVKVCGARTEADLEVLRAAGVDLAGLWHGVPGGHADLDLATAARLAAAARDEGGPEPVLVTLRDDPGAVAAAVRATGVRWVQLHGYGRPVSVRRLRDALGPGVALVKVLHLTGDGCVEAGLAAAYGRAGTDLFLLDRVGPGGRVGSTGLPVPDAVAAGAAAGLDRPFLLAGGVSAAGAGPFPGTVALPGFAGIDVDTAARGAGGSLCPARVAAVRAAWSRGCRDR